MKGYVAASLLVLAACTSAEERGPSASAGADARADAAPPLPSPAHHPAQHSPLPQAQFHGGRVIDSMKVVTVTWASDDAPLVSRLGNFGDTITSTPWWAATTSEYCAQPRGTPCVGAGSGGGHVAIVDVPPADLVDSASGASSMQDWIRTKIADQTLPAPTPETLYAIYLPTGVTITRDGEHSCDDFSAFHSVLAAANGVVATYAVMARCGDENALTTAASHELVEAATDPELDRGRIAYYLDDSPWAIFGGELADLCELVGESPQTIESGWTVHRSWSNASARAGHDPCVPSGAAAPAAPYFNAAPRQDAVVLRAAGDSATLTVDAFSDGPTADWQLSFFDALGLRVAFDKTTVNDGDHVVVTVTATQPVPAQGGAFAVVSRQGKTAAHVWWVAVHPS